jgi:hypothetical protein
MAVAVLVAPAAVALGAIKVKQEPLELLIQAAVAVAVATVHQAMVGPAVPVLLSFVIQIHI